MKQKYALYFVVAALFIVGLMFTITPNLASATLTGEFSGTVKYASSEGSDVTGWPVYQPLRVISQSFKVGDTGPNANFTIKGISVFASGNGGICNISIRGVNETYAPNETTYAINSTWNSADLPSSNGWYNITIPDANLTKDINYAIVMDCASNGVNWEMGAETGYGTPMSRFPDGFWQYKYNIYTMKDLGDMYFIVWGIGAGSSISTSLVSPTDGASLSNSTVIFNSTLTPISMNITNATLNVWYSNGTIFNQTPQTLDSAVSVNLNWSIAGLSLNSYKWNVYACGNKTIAPNDANCSWASGNYTFNVGINTLNENYNATTIEGSNEIFNINITYDNTTYILGNVYFIYNNSYYLVSPISTGGNVIVEKSFTIPNIYTSGTLVNFTWNFNFVSSNISYSVNTSLHTVTVNKGTSLTAGACSAGFSAALNFSFYNESINSSFVLMSEDNINYYFTYGLTGNSSQYSINGSLSSANSLVICINSSQTYYNLGYGEIDYSSAGFVGRRYYVFSNTRITNVTTNIPLYSLQSALSTSFKITAQNINLMPYSNNYIGLLRWYPSINSYNVVEMGKTDNKGETIVHVKTDNVDYRLALYNRDGSLINMINPIRLTCQVNPCTYTLFINTTSLDYSSYFHIEKSLIYDAAGERFIFTWNDPSQASQTMNLTVYHDTSLDSEIICSSSSSGYTGVLICSTTGYSGRLRAEAIRAASPDTLIAQDIQDLKATFISVGGGTIGLLIGAIILIFFALVGVVSPVLTVIMGVIALIPLFLLGNISWLVMVGIGVIGGVILHFLKRIG